MKMKPHVVAFAPILTLVLLIPSFALSADDKKPVKPSTQTERFENLELFQKVLHFVEQNYVDDVKNKDLIHGAIKGMLENLDPHSNFLPPDIYRDMKIDTSGKFGGLGIEIGMRDNIPTVIAPIEDTPAYRAGVKPGDKIVKIDDVSTRGMSLMDTVAKMRGKRGSDIKISIYRDGFKKIKSLTLTRELIKVASVKSDEVEPGFGYVRLTNFNESAALDIKNAIQKMEGKTKLKGLVLDLRANPGGLLDQAVEVVSLFMDEGIVVSTIGRNRDQKEIKYARKGMARKDLALAVLVNGSSASASEIVAGALQDHKRAIILGQTTFGKGSVQSVIDLGQDMGLKLTVARYYTPSGRSIQERGVDPDIVLEDYDSKVLAEARRKSDSLREKDLKGHIINEKGESDRPDDHRDYDAEELAKKSSAKDMKEEKSQPDDEDFVVKPLKAKEDYQVKQAVNYLKSFDLFKKLSASL